MNQLNYQTLAEQNFDGYLLKDAPERVLQFGEGNFLRAFVDYFVDVLNEKTDFNSKVVLCQPIAQGMAQQINEQQGLYTLVMRGSEDGVKSTKTRLISSVSRCINPYTEHQKLLDLAAAPDLRFIACNTTEAGIVYDPACQFKDAPPSSYPAKLTQFLHKRFTSIKRAKGFVILSCELIDNNGKELEKCVLQYAKQWELGDDFYRWITDQNIFCSTLVDRIVTGYPRDEAAELCNQFGYKDDLLVTSELFAFWVIEGPAKLKEELPFEKAGLPVLITDDHSPYKQRKVRILNGAHTTTVLGAYLAGQTIVRDSLKDPLLLKFMDSVIQDEIIPTLSLPKDEVLEFAKSVADRFHNPFIDHELLAISLNSTSKWRARVMPSLTVYLQKFGKLPPCITASFAFYIAFFRGQRAGDNDTEMFAICKATGSEYKICDDKEVIDFYLANKDCANADLAAKVCANTDFWGEDLSLLPNFKDTVTDYLNKIDDIGVLEFIKTLG